MNNQSVIRYVVIGAGLAPFVLLQVGKGRLALPLALIAAGTYVYQIGTSEGTRDFQTSAFSTSTLTPLAIFAVGIALAVHKPNYGVVIGAATAAGVVGASFSGI
jgi:hypothetical protein